MKILALFAVLAVVCGFLFYSIARNENEPRNVVATVGEADVSNENDRPDPVDPPNNASPDADVQLSTVPVSRPAASPEDADDEEPKSLLDGLNHTNQTIEQDLELVRNVLDNYRSVFHRNPVGTHEEIMAALTGANQRKIPYVQPDDPNLGENGRLVDRWGTPFFFHQLSSDVMEIRSAGPDRQMWTEDDVFTQ